MIISVAVQAYLSKIKELFAGQGFDRGMHVIYDSEEDHPKEWLSDDLADKAMARKRMTTKADVRSEPFMALFWTRSPLEPIVRRPYRLLETPEDGSAGLVGKATVNGKFRIACAFISNKAEAVEDLEEAFAAVFQNTYNMPISLEYIYNGAGGNPPRGITNFTFVQNMGVSNLVNYKEGNMFAYAWGADIYLNYVSEFGSSKVYPMEKVVIDLYAPGGIPLSSLDAAGKVHTHTYTAEDGTVVENVPDEPALAFTGADPHDYAYFAITAPYAIPYPEGEAASGQERPIMPAAYEISAAARELIGPAIKAIGGEVSLRSTKYMMVAYIPLSLNHAEGASYDEDMAVAAGAIANAAKTATGNDYVITPMPPVK